MLAIINLMSGRASSLPFLQYINTAFENIKEAVMLVEVESGETYRLLLANKAFYDMSGFPQDSIGKDALEILGPQGYQWLEKQFKKVVETKQPIESMHWFKVPLGRRAYETQMLPVLNAVDQVVQIIILTRDVTELTKLKEEVQTLRVSGYMKKISGRA
jgi:hypothetical protein